VRTRELETAAAHMGVDELIFLGYRDSGMAGTEPNSHPHAFMNASASAVVMRLVRLIRSLRPQVIITFDPTGGYGHPDHIASHRHTTAAFYAAADPAYAPELGPTWQAQRIFYPAFDRTIFQKLHDQIVAQGEEPPQWGIGDDEADLWPEQTIDARIDIHTVVHHKWDALLSHATQFGPNNPFMRVPRAFMLDLMHEESFELAWPAEKPPTPWHDLFAGIKA
jgi:LmbE family N-acetylglucosaminyl deacetylase